jgi:hypothetical protein
MRLFRQNMMQAYDIDSSMESHIAYLFQPTRNYKLGAYRGKHVLERHLGTYVSTEQFIQIMKDLGYNPNKYDNFKLKERKL